MIITITNQKGGIGKTTTAHNLGYGLAQRGFKVLLVDLDGQKNLTMATRSNQAFKNSYDLMTKRATAKECIQPLNDNIDIINGSLDLATLDIELNDIGKEYRLKEMLEPIKNDYDFIIIDTPPTLNIITVNALTCADRVLIPCEADIFSLDAVSTLHNKTIEVVKKYTNSNLKTDGILLTKYNDRTILAREITEKYKELADSIGTKLYNVKIRRANAIDESHTRRQDIFSYARKSKVANDYNEFIDEFLKGVGK